MSKGQDIGYIRVSSLEQNTARQLDGIMLDKVFTDKCSGKDENRPQLQTMLEFVRDGDTVYIHSMDRLARNLDDLRKIVNFLASKNVRVKFVKENLTFSGNNSPMEVLMLSVMGAFAEFERSLIKERQREGIALAKARGVYKGRKSSVTQEQIDEMRQMAADRYKKTEIAKKFGISRATLYIYLKDK